MFVASLSSLNINVGESYIQVRLVATGPLSCKTIARWKYYSPLFPLASPPTPWLHFSPFLYRLFFQRYNFAQTKQSSQESRRLRCGIRQAIIHVHAPDRGCRAAGHSQPSRETEKSRNSQNITLTLRPTPPNASDLGVRSSLGPLSEILGGAEWLPPLTI